MGLLNPTTLLATWFGAGLLPKAPGTWGSLAALPFAWVIADQWGSVGLTLATAAVFFVGIWAGDRYARRDGRDDPGPVVIDEVAGQWMTLVPVAPDPILYAAGFVLFRIADIFKPWPAGWADGHVKGGLGIMLDDMLAAIYSMAGVYGLSLLLETL